MSWGRQTAPRVSARIKNTVPETVGVSIDIFELEMPGTLVITNALPFIVLGEIEHVLPTHITRPRREGSKRRLLCVDGVGVSHDVDIHTLAAAIKGKAHGHSPGNASRG